MPDPNGPNGDDSEGGDRPPSGSGDRGPSGADDRGGTADDADAGSTPGTDVDVDFGYAEDLGGSGRPVWLPTGPTPTLVATVGGAGLAGAYLLDRFVRAPTSTLPREFPVLAGYDASRTDWLLAASLLVAVAYGLVPLFARPARARTYLRRLSANGPATLAAVYLAAFALAGLVAPVLRGPQLDVIHGYQPPVWGAVIDRVPTTCLGEVVDGRCRGTWEYPLGTNLSGEGIGRVVLDGTRVALVVALVSTAIVVPLATVTGVAAAYRGGVVEEAVLRVVDLVNAVPAFFAYVVVRFVLGGGGDLVLLVAVFGVLSWGGVARGVRNRAVQVREADYVAAAEAAGADTTTVLRRHVVPNVADVVVPAAAGVAATLVLTEAALSFLELGVPNTPSWGTVIAAGTTGSRFGDFTQIWWVSTFPVLALAATVVALNLLGDALGEVLDPRSWE